MRLVAAFPEVRVMAYVASFAIGVGMACFFMTWELLFSTQSAHWAVGQIGCAAVISSALYLIFSFVPSGQDVVAIVALFIVAACTCHSSVVTKLLQDDGTLPVTFKPISTHKAKFLVSALWKPTLCVATYGFVHEAVRASCMSEASLAPIVNPLSSIGILISGIILMCLCAAHMTDVGLASAYRIAFPVAVTGFALMPFLGQTYRYGFVAFAFMAFSVLVSLLMVSCAKEARALAVNPICAFGVASSVVYLFASFGFFFGGVPGGFSSFGVPQVFLIAFFSIYLLALISFVIRDHSICRPSMRASATVESAIGSAKVRAPIDDSCTAAESASVTELAAAREARCRGLATRFALTRRERDVLFLYAAGRDTPSICERLCISENTVRTHLRGIYRKMGIHSKQKLFDLLEAPE